jgi:hypothetical protein
VRRLSGQADCPRIDHRSWVAATFDTSDGATKG